MWGNASYVDWRITVFAELANGDYVGMPNGLTSAKAAAYNGNGLANTSKLGATFTAATAPGVLMSVSEVDFILAEAAHKNYIPGGDADAEKFYFKGIDDSYNQWGDDIFANVTDLFGEIPDTSSVDPQPITDASGLALDFYLNDDYAWDASKAMELIGTQKWVAMFDQGLQSWFEWRRLGYPVLTPAEDGVNGGKIPVRVIYPSDESARNPTNLAAGVALLGGADDLNTRVWWDTQDN
ncbi:MAG: SusD/RagB family nutrient-binding outer membrane lipoprotein [Bacteroidales bacterium]|nr:SusD/RagB family nutrient-binding outer membrane lipoprotein [Bacteroidales bacterium]